VEDKRLVEREERYRGQARLTYETYLSFVDRCRPVVDAPHVPPTYASSENGAHLDLPTPDGRVTGGAHEMVEGPPLGPFYTAIDGFAEAHFTNDRKEGRAPETDVDTIDLSQPAGTRRIKPARYLLFLIPVAILIAVLYFSSRQSSVPLGGSCYSSNECQEHVCHITDSGVFWIFGMEGFCTRACSMDDPVACPAPLRCRPLMLNTGGGTGLAHHYTQNTGQFCVP
jgi:hypothetical protein